MYLESHQQYCILLPKLLLMSLSFFNVFLIFNLDYKIDKLQMEMVVETMQTTVFHTRFHGLILNCLAQGKHFTFIFYQAIFVNVNCSIIYDILLCRYFASSHMGTYHQYETRIYIEVLIKYFFYLHRPTALSSMFSEQEAQQNTPLTGNFKVSW